MKLLICALGCSLCVSLMSFGQSAYIYGKAALAQLLIADSWHRGSPNKPWPWADTQVVAKLSYGDEDMFVLQGAQGSSLAFGPGLINNTINTESTIAIAGHRDTHFESLRFLDAGSRVSLHLPGGELLTYEVEETQVIDTTTNHSFRIIDERELLLITCYPFDAVTAGGPLRYVVQAGFVEEDNDEEKRGA